MATKLFQQERRSQILALIEVQERVSVAELCERFQVSAVTVRSDLADLERQGALVRTHGGALARSSPGTVPGFAYRQQVHAAAKERIGRESAALVKDGEAIALDDSTTAWQVARHLKDRGELTVITNGLYIALEFLEAPGVTVVMPGGTLRPTSASLVGDAGLAILEQYHIQRGFFGARGLSIEEGLTDPDPYGVAFKRDLVGRSRSVIAIVDSSKWRQTAFATFASLDQVHQVITDADAPLDMVTALQAQGIQVTKV